MTTFLGILVQTIKQIIKNKIKRKQIIRNNTHYLLQSSLIFEAQEYTDITKHSLQNHDQFSKFVLNKLRNS